MIGLGRRRSACIVIARSSNTQAAAGGSLSSVNGEGSIPKEKTRMPPPTKGSQTRASKTKKEKIPEPYLAPPDPGSFPPWEERGKTRRCPHNNASLPPKCSPLLAIYALQTSFSLSLFTRAANQGVGRVSDEFTLRTVPFTPQATSPLRRRGLLSSPTTKRPPQNSCLRTPTILFFNPVPP